MQHRGLLGQGNAVHGAGAHGSRHCGGMVCGGKRRGLRPFSVLPHLRGVSRLADTGVPDELLARACAGDAAARQAIYGVLAPATLTLIRRVVGQRAAAEDIFQDTMMTLYERLPQFRREAPLGAWLRQIAISHCLMHLRSPWRRMCLRLEAEDPGYGALPRRA